MTQGHPVAVGHGMGIAPEQKDWPDIDLNELQVLQTHYFALQGRIEILWRSPRPFSSALLVRVHEYTTPTKNEMTHAQNTNHAQTSADKNQLNQSLKRSQKQSLNQQEIQPQEYFIKRSHCSFRRVEDLSEEHRFIEFLAQHDVAVPEVLNTKLQCSALALDDWIYEVHKKAKGLDIYIDHLSWKPFFYPEHAAQTGYTLAKMHQVSVLYPIQQERSARYLVSNQQLLSSENLAEAIQHRIQSSSTLSQYFAQNPLDPRFLNDLVGIHQNIKAYLQTEQKIWTHNDLHASNLLWSDTTAQARITTVIDFGLCDYNSAIYDLAVTIERNFIDWLALEKSQHITIDEQGLTAFLNAYLSVPSVIQHIHILPELLKIVHIDFAFSELEYFLAVTGNIQHAHAAHYDWLIGHVTWFMGHQGQVLSDMIHQILNQALAQKNHHVVSTG